MCLGRCGSADPVLLPGGVRVLRPRLYGRVHPRHAPRYATGLRPRVAERRAFRGSLVQAEGAVRACPAGPGVPRGLRPRLRLGGLWGGRTLRPDVRRERVVRHVSARLHPVKESSYQFMHLAAFGYFWVARDMASRCELLHNRDRARG